MVFMNFKFSNYFYSKKEFSYFRNQKLKFFYKCNLQCPYQANEDTENCGVFGRCEFIDSTFKHIFSDKDNFFKYRSEKFFGEY